MLHLVRNASFLASSFPPKYIELGMEADGVIILDMIAGKSRDSLLGLPFSNCLGLFSLLFGDEWSVGFGSIASGCSSL